MALVSQDGGAGELEPPVLMDDEQLDRQRAGDCCALCGTPLLLVAERRREAAVTAAWNEYLEGVDYDPGAVGL